MRLAKGFSLAAGILMLACLQATAAEPAVGGSDTAAAQAQQPVTTAPRVQTQRRRSYSYQPSGGSRFDRGNRLPTWGRADSKVMFRYGVYPY